MSDLHPKTPLTNEQREKLTSMAASGDSAGWQDILTEEQRADVQAEIDRVEARMQRALARVRRSEAIVAHYRRLFYGG